MAEENKIRYSDIIQPDDSIEKLIKQLGDLTKQYEALADVVNSNAGRMSQSLKNISGATSEGRRGIDEIAASASRLERAQKELKFALSDTGKQVAWLKAQTSDANKTTVEQQRYIQQAASSYDRLKADLRETTALYKSLTEAERADSQMGQQLLNDIVRLRGQVKALDDSMRAQVSSLTAVEQAQQKLIYAQSAENQQLKSLAMQTQEANRVAKLQATIANSAEGSYNRLSAQYSLNKIALNKMSQAERETTESGKALEAETAKIYAKMIQLQEATGNHTLSVGNYKKVWNGLGFSINQVVRELPAMAVSMNTLFLAVSNNIPMVVDEIKKLQIRNQALREDGKETISILKTIVKSVFSWNTALVVVLSVLSMYGTAIADWIKSLFNGKNAVMSLTKALKNIATELEKTNNSYGSNIVKFKQLQREWKNLKTEAEKTQWIKDNKSGFEGLGMAISSVTEADNAFVKNTRAVLEALKLRAKAAAAQKLAAEQYEKALVARNKAELEQTETEERLKKRRELGVTLTPAQYATPGAMLATVDVLQRDLDMIESGGKKRAKALEDEAKAAETTADSYFDLAAGYEEMAKAELKAAGIDEPHKQTTARGREPRDLTTIISQNSIKAQKEYEKSLTALLNDSFAKRRKTAADEVQNENNKLREMLRKNEEYLKNVDGKYKKLTDDQKKQILQQNAWINVTIANNLRALALQLEQIQREQAVNSLKLQRETQTLSRGPLPIGQGETDSDAETTVTTNVTVMRDASQMEASLVEERELMRESLEAEYELVLDTNAKLLEAGDEQARSEQEILIEFNKKKLQLYANYDKQILSARERDIEDELKVVEKGSERELDLLLRQNEVRRQLALAENVAKPAAEQVSSSSINVQFDKSAALTKGEFEMTRFDEQQALDEAVFNEVERSEDEITKFRLEQERARWEKQIALAKEGGLDWSKTQIATAESMVKGVNKKISKIDDFMDSVSKKGLGGTLLSKLGFDDERIQQFESGANAIIEQLQNIMAAEVELAEQAVRSAEERTEAAQKAYDAEIEARNNGYANNVATAKKELEQEKKNQQKKQAQLEKAQRRQEALNTVVQASSLVTAAANLWASLSPIPIIGHALALAAIATMWTSFAVAKVRARQATSQSEEYGEGGLEFLEGGSHASGNDIDLQQKNRKGKNMRAEGGEALAIVNKRSTRKYRTILPDVIDSLNKGTFEDKFLRAFASGDTIQNKFTQIQSSTDLTRLENGVEAIRKQNSERILALGDGRILIIRGNVKTYINN